MNINRKRQALPSAAEAYGLAASVKPVPPSSYMEECASIEDDDEDDLNTLSDRYVQDSTRSKKSSGRPGGVNVPLNSLPKLSRHRKSDLLASELEGNPQKPTVPTYLQNEMAKKLSKEKLASVINGHANFSQS